MVLMKLEVVGIDDAGLLMPEHVMLQMEIYVGIVGSNGTISVVFFTGLEHSFVMRPSHRHCDKNSIAKRSHASVRSDFRNQTFARDRLALIFWCEGLE